MTEKISLLTIATFNNGKLAEYREMLGALPVQLISLAEHGSVSEVDETGTTFAENAELKASGYARMTGTHTLADDSGLEVAALNGRPGVLSARYGGDDLGFAGKMEMLLAEIADSGSGDRRARFVCEAAIADPDGGILLTVRGECTGTIAPGPSGSGGFGYDPIFVPDGFESTFGELSPVTKHQISHRARAFEQIIPFLRDKLNG